MSDERRLEDRIKEFATKVDKADHDSCWEWKGAKKSSGYGEFNSGGDGSRLAHRCSWRFFFGEIPEGKLVLHKCNNRGCVNPYHLYLGDHSDNVTDAIRSGTHSSSRQRRLSDGNVREIVEALQAGTSQRKIAKAFGVSQRTIYRIGKGTPLYVRQAFR